MECTVRVVFICVHMRSYAFAINGFPFPPCLEYHLCFEIDHPPSLCRADSGEEKIVSLEMELKVVGENMKQMEVSTLYSVYHIHTVDCRVSTVCTDRAADGHT